MLNVHVIGGKAEERVPKYFRDRQSVQLSTFVEKKKKKSYVLIIRRKISPRFPNKRIKWQRGWISAGFAW